MPLYKDEIAASSNREKQPWNKDQFKFDEILEYDIVKPINTYEICESWGSISNLDEPVDNESTESP